MSHELPDGSHFAELYARHLPRLTRFMRRFAGSPAEAEDLAQDAMLRAYQKLDLYDASRPFWPWLKIVATRMALNRLSRHTPEASDTPEDRGAYCDELVQVEDRQVLRGALSRLPKRQRRAVSLLYLSDLEPAEAAAALGVSRSGFNQLLYRAREGLRAELDRVRAEVLGALLPISRLLRRAASRSWARATDASLALTHAVTSVLVLILLGWLPPASGPKAQAAPSGGPPRVLVGNVVESVPERSPRPRLSLPQPIARRSGTGGTPSQPRGRRAPGKNPLVVEAPTEDAVHAVRRVTSSSRCQMPVCPPPVLDANVPPIAKLEPPPVVEKVTSLPVVG